METEKEKTLRKEYVFADSKVSDSLPLRGPRGESGMRVFRGWLRARKLAPRTHSVLPAHVPPGKAEPRNARGHVAGQLCFPPSATLPAWEGASFINLSTQPPAPLGGHQLLWAVLRSPLGNPGFKSEPQAALPPFLRLSHSAEMRRHARTGSWSEVVWADGETLVFWCHGEPLCSQRQGSL